MANDPREQPDQEGDTATEQEKKLEKVKRYQVLFSQ